MPKKLVLGPMVVLCAFSIGCPGGTPATWSVTLDQVKVQPAVPKSDTPVIVDFRQHLSAGAARSK